MSVLLSDSPFEVAPYPRAVFGVGAIARLPEFIAQIGGDRVLVVTDRGVREAGVVGAVLEVLDASGMSSALYDDIAPNPTFANIEAGTGVLAAMGPSAVVVSLGGGSVMDSAKAIALQVANPGSLYDLDYRNPVQHRARPIIAVPTTAGTGSETNSFAVITDHQLHNKLYVGNDSCMARVALLDPQLTLKLPKVATAACGMDVLTHAIESLAAKFTNPYSEGLALRAIRMVADHLPRAVTNGNDLEARSQLLFAAHLAGYAFAVTGLGLAHGIGHPLSTRVGTSHGGGLAIVLPHVLRFNLSARTDMYAQAAFAMGVGSTDNNQRSNAHACIAAVSDLSAQVGTAMSLRTVGVTDELVEVLAKDALADVVTNNNPIAPSLADVESVIRAALN